ncbi:B12-binding domain-containing radical SAM protein [Parasporobacterium paucivorans]|uniref:Radical SAM superfamily enzyme YgiQ, UPF0313 family n=1 Tax=Parasporobacterium paucivorans DSM 15970 TaxID=1122934 RepID=A0A1M6CUF1_9FIRM|nr:B12-binding domain-containing radical SAM protein [Parasporobacterium paucivorans]SHI64580.1 Radical SAM superfamily enzyme YgiQ, UPF0313 family [Parasporobacterium paucivorans DSM 15970]
MKVVLAALNAKYIHSCLAVYSLKANAAEYKNDISIEEYTINQKNEDIVRQLYVSGPDVLAFSCYIWNIEQTMRVVRDIRKILPVTRIWLGGPEAFYNAKKLLEENQELDGIMLGEGEHTFYELLRFYDGKGKSLKDVNGIVLREGSSIVDTGFRDVLNMDGLEFAYGDLSDFEHRIIYYESSRGCPFSCSYCLSSIEKKLRFRSVEKVKKDLEFFLSSRVRQVKFVDRTFNADKRHADAVWTFLLENDNGITNFHFEISADLLDEEQLHLLSRMRKGLIQLETGVQTANQATLGEIDRRMDLDKVKEATVRIRSFKNIHQHLDLIAGLPFESFDSFGRSFDEVYSLRPDMLQLGFLKVLRGSKMHDKASEYGLISQSAPPYEVMQTKWLTYDELDALKGVEEALEIYYNSGQFVNTLRCLERSFESPFEMYRMLAVALKEMNRYMKHSRGDYYECLLRSAIDANKEEIYRELLTLDLYLRENLKSRPGFAKNQDRFKEDIKNFYRDTDKVSQYLRGYEEFDSKQIARMTHIEVFERDIFRFVETGSDDGSVTGILFDYRNKDEMTNQAKLYVVNL